MKKRSNTSRYFINRGEQRMKHAHDDATKVMAQINRAYSRSTSRLNKEIDDIMGSLKGLEIEEVRKLLDAPISYDRYQELLTIYKTTKNPETKKRMQQMLKASAARGRITRKEALIEAINRESAIMGGTIADRTTNHLKDVFVSAMADNSFVGVPTKVINEVLRHNWSGDNYSNRIWRNTDILAYRIRDEILEGLTSGKGNKQIADNIAEYTDYGRYAAERLVRTETSYVVNSADLESAKRLGVKAVRFEATLDSRTSEICREHNQKIIPIDKVEIGVNAPPLHPYCRSFLVNIEEGWDYEGEKGLEELIKENKTNSEHERESSNKNYIRETRINSKVISSSEYDKIFDKLDEPMNIKRVIKENSRRTLYNRDGTLFEDLIFVDTKTGEYKVSHISSESTVKPTKAMIKMLRDTESYTIVGIHNHPNSTLPSGEDLYQCSLRKYKYGLILGHDGSVFKYTVLGKITIGDADNYNIQLDKFNRKLYNSKEDFIQNINKLFNIKIEEL